MVQTVHPGLLSSLFMIKSESCFKSIYFLVSTLAGDSGDS